MHLCSFVLFTFSVFDALSRAISEARRVQFILIFYDRQLP